MIYIIVLFSFRIYVPCNLDIFAIIVAIPIKQKYNSVIVNNMGELEFPSQQND